MPDTNVAKEQGAGVVGGVASDEEVSGVRDGEGGGQRMRGIGTTVYRDIQVSEREGNMPVNPAPVPRGPANGGWQGQNGGWQGVNGGWGGGAAVPGGWVGGGGWWVEGGYCGGWGGGGGGYGPPQPPPPHPHNNNNNNGGGGGYGPPPPPPHPRNNINSTNNGGGTMDIGSYSVALKDNDIRVDPTAFAQHVGDIQIGNGTYAGRSNIVRIGAGAARQSQEPPNGETHDTGTGTGNGTGTGRGTGNGTGTGFFRRLFPGNHN